MNKKTKYLLNYFIPVLVLIFFIMPSVLFSQGSGTPGEPGAGDRPADAGGQGQPAVSMKIKIDNPFKEDTIPGLITTLIKEILTPIGSVVAVLMIMYAGFLYVTARGNTGQITKARDTLLYAAIGAAILLGAWIISEAIQGTIKELQK